MLRRSRPDDAPAIFAIKSDPETMAYMETPPLTAVSEAEALIVSEVASFAAGDALKWAVTLGRSISC